MKKVKNTIASMAIVSVIAIPATFAASTTVQAHYKPTEGDLTDWRYIPIDSALDICLRKAVAAFGRGVRECHKKYNPGYRTQIEERKRREAKEQARREAARKAYERTKADQ